MAKEIVKLIKFRNRKVMAGGGLSSYDISQLFSNDIGGIRNTPITQLHDYAAREPYRLLAVRLDSSTPMRRVAVDMHQQERTAPGEPDEVDSGPRHNQTCKARQTLADDAWHIGVGDRGRMSVWFTETEIA